MSDAALASTLSTNDERLIEEALQRLERNPANLIHDRDALFGILAEQVRRGRRSMFSLVRAGQRTIDGLD